MMNDALVFAALDAHHVVRVDQVEAVVYVGDGVEVGMMSGNTITVPGVTIRQTIEAMAKADEDAADAIDNI